MLKHFLTVDEGLSHDEVTSIVQDNDGFIWIGTRGGLNRYDGYEFKIFNQVPGDSNSLVNPSIESLFIDKKGNIWIGSKSGGISEYDPNTGIFRNIISNYRHPNKILPDNRVLSFYEDKLGRIWMGTWDKGVIIYDGKKNSTSHLLKDLQINSIVETAEGNIWVGADGGLFEFDWETDSLIQRNLNPFSYPCQELKYDKQRTVLWVTTGNNLGLIKFDLRNHNSYQYQLGALDQNSSPAVHNYESLLVDNSGKIWVGTWGTGLYIFNPVTELFERYLIYPETRTSLNKDYDAILDIFQDKDENVWLGTNGGGVCMLTPKLNFNSISYHPEKNKGLVNTRLMSVCEDRNGNLWMGTIGSGLYWSPDRENIYPVSNPLANSSRFFIIKYLYEDTEGNIWVGSNAGTFLIDFNRGSPRMVSAETKFGNPAFRQQAVSFLDDGNMLWFGTLLDGLYLLLKNENYKLQKRFSKGDSNSGDLNSDRISCLLKDSKGRIWIGTYNGLHIFNWNDSTIHVVENRYAVSGSFTGNIITSLDEDQKGNIWIGSPNGLNMLTENSENDFKVTYYTETDGLASNFIKGIAHDLNGNIWVSTNVGISEFIVDENRFINFDETDGVKGKNFTEVSVFRNRKGELFFGGTQGLTYFNPEEIEENTELTKPVFTGFSILNQPVEIGKKYGSRVILHNSISRAKEIELAYNQDKLELQFSALDFKSQGKNRFKYLLENHDVEWNDIGTRRFLIFNNLKPGEYILKIKSSNGHALWNEEASQLKIKVLPPFWQTWYALVFYILVVIGIVSVIRWNAVKQVRLANNLELEKMQHSQDQKISEMKFQFFTNISHEFRTPLTLILAPLKEILSGEKKNQLTEEVFNRIHIVQKNASRLMKLVNQLLDFRKAETGNMKLLARNSNIEEFVQEVCLPYNYLAKINEIDFVFRSKLITKSVWFDHEKLEIILNNLISNAFEFTKGKGKIEIALYEEEDEILITVSDNGAGIPSTELKHIFDRFYRIERGDNFGSSGIGLALAKRLVELHKGSISVVSQPNVNTEFVVSLPKGSNHLNPEEMILADIQVPEINRNDQIFAGIFPVRAKAKPKSDECILIVEDNPEVNQYLESLIEPLYNVAKAFDGLEGYKKAMELKPDLIISDVMMPKMDGFEFCKRIKTNDYLATIPVILLTAKSAENFKLLGTQIGADEYITKPFDPNYLTEKIRNLLLARKKLQKQYSKSVRLEPSDVEITPAVEVFIEKTISIIENNLQNHKFSSDVLAQELNMSNSSLYRKLKEVTGSSTAGFVRSIRIKRAAQLLADKEKTITEIAYGVGFNDVKHFRTVFHKYFGCTPSDYREKL